MYQEPELRQFLTLLLAVATANSLSAASMATLLGVSHPTAARWLRMARRMAHGPLITSVYRFMADPAMDKLLTLERLNKENNLYAAAATEKLQGKVARLQAALTTQAV